MSETYLKRFSAERAKEVIRRAIEIDKADLAAVSKEEMRHIAEDIDIRAGALASAQCEPGTELVSRAPALPPKVSSRSHKLKLLAAAVLPAAASFLALPESFRDIRLVIAFFLILAAVYYLRPGINIAERHGMRIAEDGLHYRRWRQTKVRILKWSSVVRIEPLVENVINIVGAKDKISLNLYDFGDPGTVLQIVKDRIKSAEQKSA